MLPAGVVRRTLQPWRKNFLRFLMIAPAPAEQSDYDFICAALMQIERGRWFLEEYAKRNRSADTRMLLTAIQRIETVVCADRSERDKLAQQGFGTDLLEMAKAITRTRAEVAEIPSEFRLSVPKRPGPTARRCHRRDPGTSLPPPSESGTSPGPCAGTASTRRPAINSKSWRLRYCPPPPCATPPTAGPAS